MDRMWSIFSSRIVEETSPQDQPGARTPIIYVMTKPYSACLIRCMRHRPEAVGPLVDSFLLSCDTPAETRLRLNSKRFPCPESPDRTLDVENQRERSSASSPRISFLNLSASRC